MRIIEGWKRAGTRLARLVREGGSTMNPVDPKETPQPRRHGAEDNHRPHQHPTPRIGHTPGKAEGDEATVDEALGREEKRR